MRRLKNDAPTLVLIALFMAVTWAAAGDDEGAEHPDVDGVQPCDVCHAEVTPEIFQQWYAGRHGKNNVKCFVCHGTFGDRFVRTPESFRCVGCHQDQVATFETSGVEQKTCFGCHPAHLLSPHVAVDGGEK